MVLWLGWGSLSLRGRSPLLLNAEVVEKNVQYFGGNSSDSLVGGQRRHDLYEVHIV